jgi:hypothetical protein
MPSLDLRGLVIAGYHHKQRQAVSKILDLDPPVLLRDIDKYDPS